ncbi:chemotaxis protein CheW [Lysobacteraceae bacterium NML120232]|nr:chemotaxis protein CheW [Xanthomonadaceae bacterium NML08-0793]PJK11902.1 chemotaxis protein CheW [Xanthomonadaceae bacterium NML120232]
MNESLASAATLRGVMIQIPGGQLLLPNAVIAEVLSLAESEPVEGAPDWLLGKIRWHGWQVPLVAFSRLAQTGTPGSNLRGQRVLILKALGGNPRMPYMAILAQGFPRLITVPETLEDLGVADEGVPAFKVRYLDEDAMIPDLEQMEILLQDVLDG